MTIKEALRTYCEEHWWNGSKTLSYKGELKGLLEKHEITFTKKPGEVIDTFIFKFKNPYGITFTVRETVDQFPHVAKKFIQMELVRMGDRSQLYVAGCWRPTVTINKP